MENILEELNMVPGMLGSMIVGRDGLVVASVWKHDTDADDIGALSAELLGAADSLINEKLNNGVADLITIESKNVRFFIKNVDEATFLAAVSNLRTNLGLMRIEIRKTVERLKEVL